MAFCAVLRLDTPDTSDTPARARDSRRELWCVVMTVLRWCCVVEWLVACSVVQVVSFPLQLQVLCLYPFVPQEMGSYRTQGFFNLWVLREPHKILFLCCFMTEINERGGQGKNFGVIFIKIGPGVAKILPVKV